MFGWIKDAMRVMWHKWGNDFGILQLKIRHGTIFVPCSERAEENIHRNLANFPSSHGGRLVPNDEAWYWHKILREDKTNCQCMIVPMLV